MIDESTDFGQAGRAAPQRRRGAVADDGHAGRTTGPEPGVVLLGRSGQHPHLHAPGQPAREDDRGQPEGVAQLPRDGDRRGHRGAQRPGRRQRRRGAARTSTRRTSRSTSAGWRTSSSRRRRSRSSTASRWTCASPRSAGSDDPHRHPRGPGHGHEPPDRLPRLVELDLTVRRDVPRDRREAPARPEHRVPAGRNGRPRPDPLPPVRVDGRRGLLARGRLRARRGPRDRPGQGAHPGRHRSSQSTEAASGSSSTSTSRTRARSVSTRASASSSSRSRPAARCSWARSSSSSSCLRHHW